MVVEDDYIGEESKFCKVGAYRALILPTDAKGFDKEICKKLDDFQGVAVVIMKMCADFETLGSAIYSAQGKPKLEIGTDEHIEHAVILTGWKREGRRVL